MALLILTTEWILPYGFSYENCYILSRILSHKEIDFLKVNFIPNSTFQRITHFDNPLYNRLFLLQIILFHFLQKAIPGNLIFFFVRHIVLI